MLKQLSVFLQNKSGKIAGIVQTLSEEQIDIRALSIADTSDFGILRMLVSDVNRAKEILSRQNCIVSVNQVVVVSVPDVIGGLARLLSLMAQEHIDIEYMYSVVERGDSVAHMVFRVSDEPHFLQVLQDNGIETVSAEKLGIQ